MTNKLPPQSRGVSLSFLLSGIDLHCVQIDSEIEALTGYPADDFLSGVTRFDLIFHPDDRDICGQIFSHLPQPAPHTLTWRIIRNDGKVQILTGSYLKHPGTESGETVITLTLQSLLSLHDNIVERTVLKNFVAMLENTDDFIYFKDRNHVFTGASQTLVNITDPTEHWTDLIGKTDYEVFPREFADIYFTLEKKVFSGLLPVAQEIQPTLDVHGNKGWVDNRKYPIKDKNGNIVGLFGIARDITALQQAQDALQQEQTLSKALLDSLPGIFYLYSYPELRLELWNEQLKTMLGYKADEIKGRHVTDWHLPENKEAVLHAIEQVMRDGHSEVEATLVAKDGQLVPFWLTGVKLETQGRQYVLGIGIDITKRRTVETQLQASHDLLAKLSENAPGMIYQFKMSANGNFSIPYASDTIQEYYGVSAAEVRDDAKPLMNNVHLDDYDRVVASILKSARTMQTWHCEYRVNNGQRGMRWLSGTSRPEKLADGSIIWHGFISDITERKQTELRQQLTAKVFTHAHEGITITDAAGTIIDVNDTFTRITGFTREEAMGQNPRILKSGRHTPEFYAAMWQALISKGQWSGEIWNRHKNGEIYAVLLTISAVRDSEGHTQNFVALLTDITQMKAQEDKLIYMAHYDALTGLPNRTLLTDRLQQAMAQSQRRKQSMAVAYLDLDGFKAINDEHGHDVGDEFLVAISQRMKTALREVDTLARLGGDEFVAVLSDLERPQDCKPVLERLLLTASEPIILGGAVMQVSASIGVAIYPQDGETVEQLLRRADQAMYAAKQAGKNRYRLFGED